MVRPALLHLRVQRRGVQGCDRTSFNKLFCLNSRMLDAAELSHLHRQPPTM
jgi:hypothetical protein